MFYPQIMTIKPSDLVLEIGPGAYPYWRSDCLVDRFDNSPGANVSQFGGLPQQTLGKHLFHIDGPQLPFKDSAFDYVICSQVLEHVPHQELPVLIAEINRVAKRSYIEIPRPIYELIYDFEVHLNLMDICDGEIICLSKERTCLNKVRAFTQYARDLRGAQNFSIENFNLNAVAVGYEYSEPVSLRIYQDEEEFFRRVTENQVRIPKPTLSWRMRNRVARVLYQPRDYPAREKFEALIDK